MKLLLGEQVMHYRLQFKDLDYTFCLGLVLLKLDLWNSKYGKG